jgi:hypothetical protein|eukprot:COSAG01_NODE_4234_length_5218_cov_69.637429_3_plen_177_part_00
MVIPSESKLIGSSRLHDDSAAWLGKDGRWWMFVAGSAHDRSVSPKKYGLNLLYSSRDFRSWRREHSLFNITSHVLPSGKVDKSTECPFVSCPEIYRAPGQRLGQAVYEALCGKDRVWIGDFNASSNRFTPRFIQHDVRARARAVALHSPALASDRRPIPSCFFSRSPPSGRINAGL